MAEVLWAYSSKRGNCLSLNCYVTRLGLVGFSRINRVRVSFNDSVGTGWSKKRRDDGTDDGTHGDQYATGHCPVVVYMRRTHDGTLARGVVQATGQTTRRHV